MAWPIYSYRFLEAVGVTATVAYTAPAGYVTIVRDIDVYYGGGALSVACYFMGSIFQTIWAQQLDSVHATAYQWRGRQVFNAGEGFSFRSDTPVDVTISGYLIALS